MIGYTFKVYLSKSKEHFAFGETETASSPLTEKGAVKKVPPPRKKSSGCLKKKRQPLRICDMIKLP